MHLSPRATAVAALATCFALAYSSGAGIGGAGDRTGSPVAIGMCSSCHNGGDFEPTTTIELLDGDDAVGVYEPGKAYTLRVSVNALNDPYGYGYQAVVLDANSANAGTFGDAPDSFRVNRINNRDYLEHGRKQRSDAVEIAWTAPAAGTGAVSVYAAANAYNNNGGTSGDNVDLANITIQEAEPSSVEALPAAAWRVYSSGAGAITFELSEVPESGASYSVTDVAGRTLAHGPVTSPAETVRLSSPRGLAVVSIRTVGGAVSSKRVFFGE